MRLITLIFLALTIYSCQNNDQKKRYEKTYYQNELLTIPEIPAITRNDTILNNFCVQEIKSYDINDKLIRTQETNLCQSNSRKIYHLIKIYENDIIRYKLQRIGIGEQNCIEMKFDSSGNLTSKKIYLFDHKGKLIKEIKTSM